MKTFYQKKNVILIVYCIIKPLDTFSIFSIISTSVTLSVTEISLIKISKSTAVGCVVTASNKVKDDLVVISIINVKIRLTEHNRQLSLLIKNLAKVYKIKRLTKKDFDSMCNKLTKNENEDKIFSLLEMNFKIESNSKKIHY